MTSSKTKNFSLLDSARLDIIEGRLCFDEAPAELIIEAEGPVYLRFEVGGRTVTYLDAPIEVEGSTVTLKIQGRTKTELRDGETLVTFVIEAIKSW